MRPELAHGEQRALAAYEAGRRRLASHVALPLLVPGVLVAWLGHRPAFGAAIAASMAALAWVLVWRGRVAGRAVLPGALAGLLPLGMALGAQSVGHVCTGTECYSLCVPACATGGVLAGLLIARLGRHVASPLQFWAVAGLLAALEGSLGCSCVGLGGIAGLILGLSVTVLPTWVAARKRV